MARFVGYYDRFRGVRSDLSGLPPWARVIFLIVVSPAIALVALSFLALIVSVLVLLAVAIPAYSLLRMLTVPRSNGAAAETELPQAIGSAPDARHVEVTIREPPRIDGADSNTQQ